MKTDQFRKHQLFPINRCTQGQLATQKASIVSEKRLVLLSKKISHFSFEHIVEKYSCSQEKGIMGKKLNLSECGYCCSQIRSFNLKTSHFIDLKHLKVLCWCYHKFIVKLLIKASTELINVNVFTINMFTVFRTSGTPCQCICQCICAFVRLLTLHNTCVKLICYITLI